jgi:Flp pilus assembly protein TadD
MADLFEPAWHDFVRALESDPTDAQTYDGLIKAAVGTRMGRIDETVALLRRLAEEPAHLEAGLALSRLLAAHGAFEEATSQAVELARRHPGDIRVLDQLAAVYSDAGDVERLEPVVMSMRKDAPTAKSTRYRSAELLFMRGRPDLALREVDAVVSQNPQHAPALNLRGAALASLGELDRARDSFEASLRAEASRPITYTNLAMLERQAGNFSAAAQRYAEALTLDPSSEIASRGLAEVTALSHP